jgi:AraC family transcriptional regulator
MQRGWTISGNSMLIQNQQIIHGANVNLAQSDDSSLVVVVGGGRGCTLNIGSLAAGIWLPLRGSLQLIGSSSESVLRVGELSVTEPGTTTRSVANGNSLWIALLGSEDAWRRELAGTSEYPIPSPVLLPARHAADRALRRRAIALARSSVSGRAHFALFAVLDSVLTLQSKLGHAIARCPGRTYAQRRQVFLRLQRVRNYLSVNCHVEVDNDVLARMANYSPCHFIRTFRAAYQETPHAFLVDQRLQRARRLLRTTVLAVTEVAQASGFENRCAFARLFRQRFGTTAGAVRRRVETSSTNDVGVAYSTP